MPNSNETILSIQDERCYSNSFTEIIERLATMTEQIQDAPAPDFANYDHFEAMGNLRYYLEMAEGELKNL